eukprot:1188844-Prorocentrum_minimum.AAC.4
MYVFGKSNNPSSICSAEHYVGGVHRGGLGCEHVARSWRLVSPSAHRKPPRAAVCADGVAHPPTGVL